MKLGRLNHVGVATPSIEQSLELYRNHVRRRAARTEPFDLPGAGRPRLLRRHAQQPDRADRAARRNLADREVPREEPLGGQHHVCFEVPDIHAAKAEFEAKGARVLGEPRIGAHGTLVFFVHPKDMGGVLTEIMETPKGSLIGIGGRRR